MEKYHVAIVGGGMVGASLACLLAEKGMTVALIDAAKPFQSWPDDSYDSRVSALSLASVNMLKELDVWSDITQLGEQTIEKMFVWDHFGSAELAIDSADAGHVDMGSVVENRVIVFALWKKLQSLDNCTLYHSTKLESFSESEEGVVLQLSQQQCVDARLLVGADGANSQVREFSQIDDYGWQYQQTALVATVKADKSHQKTAWQRFLPEGPLALLPLRDGLISIVWSLNPATAEAYLNLSEAEFCEALFIASEQQLGRFKLIGQRAKFPLKMKFSIVYTKPRMALVGDAIHAIHPLAGQGVNLGFQDAMSLASIVLTAFSQGRDIGSSQVLKRYERQRKADNLLMMGIMDALKRLFGSDKLLTQVIRSTGMKLINQSAQLKNQLCKYAMGLKS